MFFGEDGAKEHLSSASRTVRIFITGENVLTNWNEADYALTHERRYDDRHWRVPLFRHWYDTRETRPVRDFSIVKARVSRFCNFIYSNERARERISFLEELDKYKRVDSGGAVRNNIGRRVDDKLAFIRESKFTIAFENESTPGYVTEKIIQPLIEGSIPIYWGDPTITKDFNPECFINVHDYSSFSEVVQLVRRIDEDDSLWRQYVSAPIFPNGELPDELSDEAIINFFKNIFANPTPRIGRSTKLAQKIGWTFGRLKGAAELRGLRSRLAAVTRHP